MIRVFLMALILLDANAQPGAGGAEPPGLREPNEARSLIRQLNEAFVEVASELSKSVVIIEVFEQSDNPSRRFRGQSSRGSGMVITEDGYILTNSHVLESAGGIRVKFMDGREYPGTIRGVDGQSDVAVVKIEGDSFQAVRFADSDKTRVGEFAIAIGAPFNLDYSVTVGHVSAKGRSGILNDGAADQDFIQTDASINPGNSGGPLVNIFGEVIGVNTLIRGIGTGISFAIPSNLAREVSEGIIRDGKFIRGWLGVQIESLGDYNINHPLRNEYKTGVVISSILPNGPASHSELRRGDLIRFVDSVEVRSAQDLRDRIRTKQIGSKVVLDVIRDRHPIQIEVFPEAWPEEYKEQASAIELIKLKVSVGLFEIGRIGSGLFIMKVETGGPGELAGLRHGDIILKIDHETFSDSSEAIELLDKADIEKGIHLEVVRQGRTEEIIVKATTE